mgnify:FL=1
MRLDRDKRYKRSTERIGRTQKSMLLVNLDMKLNKFLNRYLPEGMVITGIEKGCRSDSILARLTSLLDGALLLNAFCEAYSVFQ